MTTATDELPLESFVKFDPYAVREQIHRILNGGRNPTYWVERRGRRRILVQQPVHLTPVVVREEQLYRPKPGQTSLIANTTDVSLSGLGLIHDEPLPTTHGIITFDVDDESSSLLIEIEWSYGGEDRSYRSGARFVGVAQTPDFLISSRNRSARS